MSKNSLVGLTLELEQLENKSILIEYRAKDEQGEFTLGKLSVPSWDDFSVWFKAIHDNYYTVATPLKKKSPRRKPVKIASRSKKATKSTKRSK